MPPVRYLFVSLLALACAPETDVPADGSEPVLPAYAEPSAGDDTTTSFDDPDPDQALSDHSVLLGFYLEDAGLLAEVAQSGLAQSEEEGRGIFFAEMDLSAYGVPTLEELEEIYPPEVVENREQPASSENADGSVPPPYGTNVCNRTCSASYWYWSPYMYRKQSVNRCASGYNYYVAVGSSSLCRCG